MKSILWISSLELATKVSLIARFMGLTWGHLGPTGPRWAPCWPHEPCYLGSRHVMSYIFLYIKPEEPLAYELVNQGDLKSLLLNKLYSYTRGLLKSPPAHNCYPIPHTLKWTPVWTLRWDTKWLPFCTEYLQFNLLYGNCCIFNEICVQ